MKKITFIASLLAFTGAFAQFPTPYCQMQDDFEGVEEITYVDFGGTTITNTNDSDILLDFISTIANVTQGDPYQIEVHGNSHGDEDDAYENE